jgi:iron complex transport system ATP-binding protein
VISCTGVTASLGGRVVLRDVDLTVGRGDWLSVVGPNGAGKSTLLRVLAGLVPAAGAIHLDGRPARRLHRRERARLIALVPQAPIVPDGTRVLDYVLLGRSPHIGMFGMEGPRDLAAAQDALAHLDLLGLSDRVVTTLSGGERQRVFIARALAQGAPIVLLDEPTTALDVGHQQQVLELVDQLRQEHHLTVVTTMHDLTLAGQYAERLVLFDSGRVIVAGPAQDVLTEANLSRYYGARVRVIHDGGGRPAVLPFRKVGP